VRGWVVKLTLPYIVVGECSLGRISPSPHTYVYVDLGKKEEQGDDLRDTPDATCPQCAPVAICLAPPSLHRAPPFPTLVLLVGACSYHLTCSGRSKEREGREEGLIANFMWCGAIDSTCHARSKGQTKDIDLWCTTSKNYGHKNQLLELMDQTKTPAKFIKPLVHLTLYFLFIYKLLITTEYNWS
jgi:hypothetical protein